MLTLFALAVVLFILLDAPRQRCEWRGFPCSGTDIEPQTLPHGNHALLCARHRAVFDRFDEADKAFESWRQNRSRDVGRKLSR